MLVAERFKTVRFHKISKFTEGFHKKALHTKLYLTSIKNFNSYSANKYRPKVLLLLPRNWEG